MKKLLAIGLLGVAAASAGAQTVPCLINGVQGYCQLQQGGLQIPPGWAQQNVPYQSPQQMQLQQSQAAQAQAQAELLRQQTEMLRQQQYQQQQAQQAELVRQQQAANRAAAMERALRGVLSDHDAVLCANATADTVVAFCNELKATAKAYNDAQTAAAQRAEQLELNRERGESPYLLPERMPQ